MVLQASSSNSSNQISSQPRVAVSRSVDGVLVDEPTCVVPISLGSEAHEGQNLKYSVEVLNRQQYSKVTFVIADTLYFHTEKMQNNSKTNEEIYTALARKGDEWYQRNKEILSKLGEYTVLHWDYFRMHQDFPLEKGKIEHQYQTNNKFAGRVHQSAKNYIKRNFTQRGIVRKYTKDEFNYCKDYILEECAVLWLWARMSFAFIAYPYTEHSAMHYTRQQIQEHSAEYEKLLIFDEIGLVPREQRVNIHSTDSVGSTRGRYRSSQVSRNIVPNVSSTSPTIFNFISPHNTSGVHVDKGGDEQQLQFVLAHVRNLVHTAVEFGLGATKPKFHTQLLEHISDSLSDFMLVTDSADKQEAEESNLDLKVMKPNHG